MPETATATFTIEEVKALVAESVNAALNGYDARLRKELGKIHEKTATYDTVLEELKAKPVTKPDDNTVTDPKIPVLERQLRELQDSHQKVQEKAAKTERDSAISRSLSTYVFANETARDVAFKTFSTEVQTTSDGQYVIGDQPLDTAVKGRMENLTGLLAPKQVGGSGASGGTTQQTNSPLMARPGMKREELEAVGRNIAMQYEGFIAQQ